MSNYGIEIRNQNGDILIDGNFANLFLKARFSGSWIARTTDNSGKTGKYIAPLTLNFSSPVRSNLPPVCCFRGLNAYVGGELVGRPGNWTGIRLITELANEGKSISYRAEVYVQSGDAPNWAGGNYGIQVFNESASLVFDSRKYPILIGGIANIPNVSSSDNDVEKRISAGSTPDSMINKVCNFSFSSSNQGSAIYENEYVWRVLIKESGGSVYQSLRYTGYDSRVGYDFPPGAYAEDGLRAQRKWSTSPVSGDLVVCSLIKFLRF